MGHRFPELVFTNEIANDLKSLFPEFSEEKIFVLMDTHTQQYCWPMLCHMPELTDAEPIILKAGEAHKTLESAVSIWEYLSSHNARRSSLFINLGGGTICDLGGFAASTFKRGIPFINIPTTLLAQVDASVGGKTGFNFNGLKNEIGVINQPRKVLIDPDFLKTLPRSDFLSGYAEMLKHALIYSGEYLEELLQVQLETVSYEQLLPIIRKSVKVKEKFVAKDPLEKNIRKALNFGHTLGHAFEALTLERENALQHGIAVAFGIIGELFLSVRKKKFPYEKYLQVSKYIRNNYPDFSIFAEDYPVLYQLMLHDKKNNDEGVNFTLLSDVGMFTINQICTEEEIYTALDEYGKQK